MDDTSLIHASALSGAAGAVLVFVGRRRSLLFAGNALLTIAVGGLAYALAPADRAGVDHAVLFAVFAVGALVVGVLAFACVRLPAAIPVVLLAVAPFRIPVEVGGDSAFLLLPLYVVLAGVVLAFLLQVARSPDVRAPPFAVAIPSACLVALAAASTFWSVDIEASAVKLLFFYFPFSALFAVVSRLPIEAFSARALAVGGLGVAVVLGAVGLSQLWTHELPFAHDLEQANAYTSFFRTTSVFQDPSVYGRHLVEAIVVVVGLLWLDRIGFRIGVAVVAFLAVALYFTYSQSSMTTLAVVLVFVTLLAADRRSKAVVLAASALLAVAAAAAVVAIAHAEPLRRVTSGRSDLAVNASEIAAAQPLRGVGIGAEERAARELLDKDSRRLRKASHTTPLGIAAELGALGLVAYVAFLTGAARVLTLAFRRTRALGIALAAVVVVIFVHSLFYAGFYEDPLLWLALAIGAAVAATPALEERSAA